MASLKRIQNGQHFRFLGNLISGIALLFPFALQAEEVQPELPISTPAISESNIFYQSPVEQPEDLPPKPNFIDLQRDYMAEKFVDFASEIDNFFGTERHFQETNRSVMQIDATRFMQQHSDPTIALTFKAKLHLPNAQKKFHLMLESNPDKNLPGSPLSQQIQQQQLSLFKEVSTPDSFGAALRFENNEDSHWKLSADSGLKLDNISVHPFIRSSASYNLPLDLVQLKWTESLYWFNTTGAGENSLFEVDHHFTDNVLFRATSGATFLYNNQYFDLHQDFSVFHTLDQQASLLYQLAANGVSRPAAEVTEYVAMVLYRRLIHRDWIFLELNPQLHYPKANDFQLNSEIIVRLEFMFSK